MKKSITDIDVLIVGAGPVGLFLANECARRSLRFRIIEKKSGQSEHSKALAVMPRTLEILDMAGLVQPFLETGNPTNSIALVADRSTLTRVRFAPEESPYPFIAMVPQNVTESLLVQALARKGGAVEYDTNFVSAVQSASAVDVSIEQNGRRSSLSASYVVACDGAHSAVRKLLELPFAGAEYHATFMLADIDTNGVLPANEMQLCSHANGPLAMFPMSKTRSRVVATVQSANGDAPTLDFVQSMLVQRAPAGIEARSLHWSSYFRVHHRQVAQLQAGRIFLAGDSAHIHSPFGGQGMNTGLQDAWNLVWKLDLAVRGHAQPSLLLTYSTERRPVIKRVIKTTDLITKAMGTTSNLAQILRDALIPVVTRNRAFRRNFVQRLSQLGVTYKGSPIVEGAGERYFDPSLRGGDGIRSRFLLFAGYADGQDAALRQFAADFADVVELRPQLHAGIRLVRPDGYTGYVAGDIHKRSLEAVRRLLQTQVA